MPKLSYIIWHCLFSLSAPLISACKAPVHSPTPVPQHEVRVRPGAWQTEAYYPMLKGKKFAIVCNHTATVGVTHLVDTLIRAGLKPSKLFAPEHGFRGDLPDGHHFGNRVDKTTGIPIISVYGQNKKPQKEDLADLDVMVFDIQDVGARFYTYLSTMHYIMQACAELDLPLIVLDRPNPNGHCIDGPLLDWSYESFVGMHPVPVVYGMTIGEYASMINGEGWLEGDVVCDLKVIPLSNYDRKKPFELLDRPSPNLPNMRAIYLYPSLCFFEGTKMSVGRGTPFPFQLIGHPDLQIGDTRFMPVSKPESTDPPQKNKECRGFDLTELEEDHLFQKRRIDLKWLLESYAAFPDKEAFFLKSGFFDKLAGTDKLRLQITMGLDEVAIRDSWQPGLRQFRSIRKKYLLYPDFEDVEK
ncbi:MAG: DUF1343 domain-containing protein [Saprospiraceae bacterium]|nr:DUF1343 domain-containing protein [Saprospiraceae bacterium]